MRRVYQQMLQEHLEKYRQMVFISGPRQVGKTTLAQSLSKPNQASLYLNWDNLEHRELILSGSKKITDAFDHSVLSERPHPIIIFDEIHKYRDWKNILKGYFDALEAEYKLIVTGSTKLDIYRHGGDSMMGRYFIYRVHPLSVAEILQRRDFAKEITQPTELSEEQWQQLLAFGGFPEPYLMAEKEFYQRWVKLKNQQLIYEDLRDLSNVYDLSRLELLAHLLIQQIGSTVTYSGLAKKVRCSEPTIRSWLNLLENLYYCFSIKPWSKNVSRSLLKEPKIYLWDWSTIDDPGAKIENLVACHLLKAVHLWTDLGMGNYELFYLRDKDKREVDFLVTKDQQPWLMVEVKNSGNTLLSPHLLYFNQQLAVPHVFQVAAGLPFVNKDCFDLDKPMIVPLLTFLSQLV